MKRAALTGAILLAVALGALGLRLPALSARPMHTDEAIHAWKFAEFLDGEYRYSPADFHGPTLYYATLPAWWLGPARDGSEATEATFRVVGVVSGALLVLLLWGLATGLGRLAVVGAGLLVALSPAMVFYSRYYIQEMLLVLFTAGVLVAGWRYTRRPGIGWALGAGISAGLMHATKETAALALLAMAVALVGAGIRRRPRGFAVGRKRMLVHVTAGALAAAVTAALVLSQFGRDPAGPWESLRSFSLQGAPRIHHQPWHFYLGMLLFSRFGQGPIWSEGLILALAAVGLGVALRGRGAGGTDPRLARFVALYAIVLTAVYSAIPYKTPWSLLSFHFAWILLAGTGGAALMHALPGRVSRSVAAVVLVAGLAHLGWQAWRAAFPYCADSRNPYAYAQTVPDTVRLGQRVEALATLHPDGADMRVNVVAPGDDYWPLPWYLRRLNPERIGYWSDVPPWPDAPVVIASASVAARLEATLEARYHQSVFGLRPTVLLVLFVEQGLWDAFLDRTARRGDRGAADREANGSNRPSHVATHRAMGTTFQVRIQVAGDPGRRAPQATEAAFELLDRLEACLSHYRPTSDVSAIGRLEAGEPLRVAPAVFECLETAQRVHRETRGAFDVTIGPWLRCWRTREGKTRSPTPDELAEARRLTGMALIELDGKERTIRTRVKGVQVDLGGIGKGYAVDRMAALLEEWNIEAVLIHGGHSSVLARGAPAGRSGWPVSISDPDEPARTLAAFPLVDRALSASGTGTRGRHIVDPRTGRLADRYRAVWALAPTATEADALSTAFMVMSPDEIEAYCREHPDVAAMLLGPGGRAGRSAALRFGRW